jgi:hypothetical protein
MLFCGSRNVESTVWKISYEYGVRSYRTEGISFKTIFAYRIVVRVQRNYSHIVFVMHLQETV